LIAGEEQGGNPGRAIGLLEEAASGGKSGPAYLAIAEYYLAQDQRDKALDALDLAAKTGEPRALLLIGEMLVGDDEPRAVALLEQAANAGLPGPAYSTLGLHYRELGKSREAARILRKAADAGDAKAKVALGEMLIKGEGVPVDRKAAQLLLEDALAKGTDPSAYVGLIGLAADAFRQGDQLDLAVLLLRGASTADPQIALAALSGLADNEKTAVIQAVLKGRDIYGGATNGKLTRATLTAISKFCSEQGVEQCKTQALPVELLSALVEALRSQDMSLGSSASEAAKPKKG
jgi:TPR repeat protein